MQPKTDLKKNQTNTEVSVQIDSHLTPLTLEQSSYTTTLVEYAKKNKIYEQDGWHRRLFYFDGHFHDQGVFDDETFYFSKRGKNRPDEEMFASLIAFLNPGEIKIQLKTQHPRCLFPARWYWLKKNLQIDESKVIKVNCPDVDRFLAYTQYTTVSLVFTNYFIGSPGSMFGHTLLRLGREDTKGANNAGLLDDAANFSAFVPVFNAITYPIKGMFGFFDGRFAVIPYYQKVQEYNNHERRDLWEYELNFNKEELYDMTIILYELGFFKIDYWYLDDNCSFIMLMIFDAVRPSLQVSDKFHLYAIPADTLKSAATKLNLVKNISYKPSSYSRYVGRMTTLAKTEQKIVIDNIKNDRQEPEFPAQCDQACQARVLDTLIEYIDFSEKMAGNLEPTNYKSLRSKALMTRANNPTTAEVLKYRPEKERPDLGHESSLIGVQTGVSDNGEFVGRFQWKPALHDFFANDLGYGDQMQIAFLDHNFTYFREKNKLIVDEVRFLELGSFPKDYPLYSGMSWRFILATENNYFDFDRVDRFSKHYVSWGPGKNFRFFDGRLFLYGLLNVEAGYSPHSAIHWFTGFAPEVGVNIKFSDDLKLSLLYKHFQIWGETNEFDYGNGMARITYSPNVNHEFFVSSQYEFEAFFTHFGYRMYY